MIACNRYLFGSNYTSSPDCFCSLKLLTVTIANSNLRTCPFCNANTVTSCSAGICCMNVVIYCIYCTYTCTCIVVGYFSFECGCMYVTLSVMYDACPIVFAFTYTCMPVCVASPFTIVSSSLLLFLSLSLFFSSFLQVMMEQQLLVQFATNEQALLAAVQPVLWEASNCEQNVWKFLKVRPFS